MENAMRIFDNPEFGSVRTVEIDGEAWLVGKDVADALGYSNSRDALKKHVDEEDKGVAKCDTLGGKQNLPIINESGLYSLVMASKLPDAKKFKRWVTSEVLPAIRKHETYMTPEMIEKVLLTPDMVIGLATKLKEEQEKNREQQATIVALTEEAQKWDAKSVINALVRKYASVRCGCDFKWAWNKFYKDLEYKEHISLKKRCSKGKKNTPMIDFLVESEYPAAIKIAVALCESVDIDTGKIINEVNLANVCAAPA